ncbi:MAG: prepilin-type N-terminal cleavage/methylation domain-containing protein [Campylobacterota bacterium]|nr:prepilin-type N-terminal cleavage/methylation domain-containing protein [Campylobacterota bacterium]
MSKKDSSAFTLIELLVVIIIISLIYGVVFNNFVNDKTRSESLNIFNMKKYLNDKLKDEKGISSLVCSNKLEKCYLLNRGKTIDTIDFRSTFETYYLRGAEEVFRREYPYMKIDEEDFRPSFILQRYENKRFSPLILKDEKDRWYYLTSFFKNVEVFNNSLELVEFIQQKDYLPMNIGHADE